MKYRKALCSWWSCEKRQSMICNIELVTESNYGNSRSTGKEIKQRNKRTNKTVTSIKYLSVESSIIDLSKAIRWLHSNEISEMDLKYPGITVSNDRRRTGGCRLTWNWPQTLENFLVYSEASLINKKKGKLISSSNKACSSDKDWMIFHRI